MTYIAELENKSEIAVQSDSLILRVQIDQSVYRIPINKNSVINCTVIQKNQTRCRKSEDLPPKLKIALKKYEPALELLKSLGFNNIRKNLIVLRKTDGDVNKAVLVLQKHQKPKDAKFQELFQRYSNEVNILAAKGFSNTFLVLRLLKKFDGNVERAERFLVKKQQHHDGRDYLSKKEKMHKKLQFLNQRYAAEVESLATKGFSNTNLVLRLLHKFEGDVAQVEQFLLKKQLCQPEMRSKLQHHDGQDCLGKKEKMHKKLQYLNQRYATEAEILATKGFLNTNLVLRLLNKCDGNVEQVEKILLIKSQRKQKGQRGCFHIMKESEYLERYSEQLSQMEQLGLRNKRKNFIALRRCDGDVETALEWLSTRV